MVSKGVTKSDKLVLSGLIERAKTLYQCNRGPRPSGALLVSGLTKDGDRAVMYGDVSPSDGSHSCVEVGCMMVDGHCVRNIHAEVQALLKSAKYGLPTVDGIMYSINKPCYNCTIACIAAGVTHIIYAYAVYDEERTQQAIQAAGIECVHVPV